MKPSDRPDDAPPESAGRVIVYGVGFVEISADTMALVNKYVEMAQDVICEHGLVPHTTGPAAPTARRSD